MLGIEVGFGLEDLSPMMFNMYLDEPQPKTPEGFREQGPRKVHRDASGDICITPEMIIATVMAAAGELAPRGKGKITRRNIMAGLFFKEEAFSLGKDKPDLIDHRPVYRGKGEKMTLVICYRPLIKKWKIEGTMILLGLQPRFIKEALEYAGINIGLGSYRPRFGRFTITKWEVKEKTD